jgi:putative oxidoreductase
MRISLTLTDKHRDYGLLMLRVGIGFMFVVVHGFPKIGGGLQTMENLGKSMSVFGITFAPIFWGFMATVSEVVGGICLITGVLFRLACALMMFTMFMAVVANFRGGYGLASQPLELCILFLSLIFIGAGKFTIPGVIGQRKAMNISVQPTGR